MANEIIREGQEQTIQVQKQNYTVGVFPAGTKTITTNGTHDVTEYASVDAQVAPVLQNKEVTITANGTQTVQTDEGYEGMSAVVVNTTVTPNLQNKEVSITSNGTQIVQKDDGYYGLEAVTINANVGFPPNWSELGYESTPSTVLEGFEFAKTIYQGWNPSITTMYSKYMANNNLMFFPLVDTSNCVSFSYAFASTRIVELPLINTSNATDMSLMFFDCHGLNNIAAIDTHAVKNFSMSFYYCSGLMSVPQLDLSSATNLSSMFQNCSSLSNESLNNILASLVTATSYSGQKKLSSIGLTSNQAQVCRTLSNWQACVDAGWTS